VKKTIGLVLMLIGGLAITGGIVVALRAFASMYSSALADPLSTPERSESQVSESMLRGVYIGAPGAVVFVVGRIVHASARRRARGGQR
jgi:hypothetical protein